MMSGDPPLAPGSSPRRARSERAQSAVPTMGGRARRGGGNAEARSGVGVGLLLLVAIDDLDGSRRGAYQFEIAHHQKMNQVAPVSEYPSNGIL